MPSEQPTHPYLADNAATFNQHLIDCEIYFCSAKVPLYRARLKTASHTQEKMKFTVLPLEDTDEEKEVVALNTYTTQICEQHNKMKPNPFNFWFLPVITEEYQVKMVKLNSILSADVRKGETRLLPSVKPGAAVEKESSQIVVLPRIIRSTAVRQFTLEEVKELKKARRPSNTSNGSNKRKRPSIEGGSRKKKRQDSE